MDWQMDNINVLKIQHHHHDEHYGNIIIRNNAALVLRSFSLPLTTLTTAWQTCSRSSISRSTSTSSQQHAGGCPGLQPPHHHHYASLCIPSSLLLSKHGGECHARISIGINHHQHPMPRDGLTSWHDLEHSNPWIKLLRT